MADDNDTTTGAATPTPTATPPTAAEAYAHRAGRIGSVLGWLGDELESHAATHRDAPGDWRLVTDLAALEAVLKVALCHIACVDAATVEEVLDDLDP